jgi:hypothetical protein
MPELATMGLPDISSDQGLRRCSGASFRKGHRSVTRYQEKTARDSVSPRAPASEVSCHEVVLGIIRARDFFADGQGGEAA